MVVPDTSLEMTLANKYDIVILPGGLGGSKAMAESALVGELLKQQQNEDRIVAAICAAPTALAAHKIYTGKSLTSYPSVKSQVENLYKYVTSLFPLRKSLRYCCLSGMSTDKQLSKMAI